jgi:hypothetical protein
MKAELMNAFQEAMSSPDGQQRRPVLDELRASLKSLVNPEPKP